MSWWWRCVIYVLFVMHGSSHLTHAKESAGEQNVAAMEAAYLWLASWFVGSFVCTGGSSSWQYGQALNLSSCFSCMVLSATCMHESISYAFLRKILMKYFLAKTSSSWAMRHVSCINTLAPCMLPGSSPCTHAVVILNGRIFLPCRCRTHRFPQLWQEHRRPCSIARQQCNALRFVHFGSKTCKLLEKNVWCARF